MEYKNEINIRQRIQKDIWQQLYEFPLIETSFRQRLEKVIILAEKNRTLSPGKYKIVNVSPHFNQLLSHQYITGQFIRLQIGQKPKFKESSHWITKNKLEQFAFPKLINQYLKELFISSN
jgi:A/G-specific adenine glycosylase